MAHHLSAEEKQILKLLEKIQVDEALKNGWVEAIQTSGITEEIAEEVRKALTSVPEGESETGEMARGRQLVEFTTLIKRWRLAYQSKNFGRR